MMFTLLLVMGLQSAAPKPLAGHVLVFSAEAHSVLLVGGDAEGKRPLFAWRNGAWNPIKGSEFPVRSLPAVASDDKGNLLLHGGSVAVPKQGGGVDYKMLGDTWLWNGKTWKQVATTGPSSRDHHTLVFDSHRRRFVLFGGSNADTTGRSDFFGDTWEWDGTKWNMAASSGPGPRCHHTMSYDPVRQRVVLVGGYGARGGDAKTWTWDGTTWSVAANGPPADRSGCRAVWDAGRKLVLLFGGEANQKETGDTWAWDGKSWKSLLTSGPPGRTVRGMAYDPERGVTVLYGGSAGSDVVSDVWELSASQWKKVAR